jgi:large subunit ribosomal protein L10
MARELKTIICEQMAQDLGSLDGCVMINYAGLNSEQTSDLRTKLRDDGVTMRIVHNRLAKRVFGERDDLPGEFTSLFRGPIALLISDESALTAAKSLSNWKKKNKDKELAAIKGGLFEGKVLSVEDVDELAKIPDKPTLLAQTVGMFLSPVQYLPSAAKSLVSHLAGCAKAQHEKLSELE